LMSRKRALATCHASANVRDGYKWNANSG